MSVYSSSLKFIVKELWGEVIRKRILHPNINISSLCLNNFIKLEGITRMQRRSLYHNSYKKRSPISVIL